MYTEEVSKEAKRRQATSTGGSHPQLSANLNETEKPDLIRTAAEAQPGTRYGTFTEVLKMKTLVMAAHPNSSTTSASGTNRRNTG